MKIDLNCLEPVNVHLNNLNAPVLSVLRLGRDSKYFHSLVPVYQTAPRYFPEYSNIHDKSTVYMFRVSA